MRPFSHGSPGRVALVLLAVFSLLLSAVAPVSARPAPPRPRPASVLGTHDASDFFIFAKAAYGKAAETNCDGSQDNQASVQGSTNLIFGRIHSNADWNASGQNNQFFSPVTYGTHDEDCTSNPGSNDYSPPPPNNGSPTEVDASPSGVGTGGWPGNLGNHLNSPAYLQFGGVNGSATGADIQQVLGPGAKCDVGDLTLSSDYTINPVSDNNKVICRGTGKVQLNVQNATMKVTIISHGLIEISGQNALLSPADAGHGILAWTDQDSNTQEFSAKVAGSNFRIGPSIIFTPRSGQDISGSQGSELCIQHIGQGQIKIQGSVNEFGPGACGPPPAQPNVSVVKTPDGASVNAGQTATFSITVTNSGPGASTVTLSDTLPDGGLTWTESADPANACTVSAPPAPQTLTCNFGSVPDTAGQNTRTVSVSSATDSGDCGTKNNTVTITASGDVTPANNSDTGSIVIACPDVSVVKTPDEDTTEPIDPTANDVTAGDPAIFSITVTNHGPGAASNVTLVDNPLPNSGLNWSEASDPANACAVTGAVGSQRLDCNFGTLAQGDVRTVSISSQTDGADCGTKNNTVTISATGDINPANNSDPGEIDLLCGDIDVDKTPDEDTTEPIDQAANDVTAGDEASFTIVTRNTGEGAARGVKLTDTLPAVANGWAIASGSTWPGEAGCTITPASSQPQTLTCGGSDGVTLATNASLSVTVTTTTTAAECGTLANPAASATSANDGSDSDDGEIDVDCPAIVVEKTPDEDTSEPLDPAANDIVVGDQATFVIKVRNTSLTAEARDVDLLDVLPDVDELAAPIAWSIVTSPAGATTLANCTISDPASGDHAAAGEVLSCPDNTIAANTFKQVTVTATTDAGECGSLANPEATATAGNDGTSTDAGEIDVLCPDPSVLKSAVASPITAGDEASFTITVTAGGTGDSSGVTLSDTLPAGHTWTVTGSDADDCTDPDPSTPAIVIAGGQTLTCEFGTIPNGQSRTVTLTATSSAADCANGITNTATIDADADTDTSAASNSSTAHIDVDCPDLALDKSVDETDLIVRAPDSVVYTIVVTNNGDGEARDVVITDELDPNVVVDGDVTYDIGQDGVDGTCDVDTGLKVITCDIGDLAAGESVEVVYTVDLPVEACPSAENTASVETSNEAQANEDDNSDSVTLDVDCPDVSVVKTAADPVISSTEEASFTITVDGGALGTSDDVILTDELPIGFSWTVGGADINECSDDAFATTLLPGEVLAGGTRVECNFGALDPDETKTITLTATTAEDDCGLTIANTAVVSTAGDTDASNNSSRATIQVECPDLDITKTADDELVSAGERIGFVITVRNSADATATALDVTLSDPLPQDNGINWRIADDSPDAGACTIEGDAPAAETLTCAFGDLAPGATRSVHVVSDTTLGSCETHPNTATVDADNHPPVPANDSLTVECPGLNIAKEAGTRTIDAGETAIFDIVVWNRGPGTAFDVSLTDELPGDLDWAEDSDDCSISGGVLTCDFGDLGVTTKANSPARVTLSAETDRADCGVLDNEAIADSDPGQPVRSDDSISVKCPTIGLEKENDAAASVLPGTTVTYTLTLTVSDGPAGDVVVIDALPDGLEDPTNISDGGQYDEATSTITWELGDLADGTYRLTYEATVADDVPNGAELVNAAAATSPNSQCPDFETLGPDCEDDSIVVVRVPTLVIDKVANVEVITISGPADDQTASPSVVTWTLSYTLSNGPVTNAVITDVVPVGLVYAAGSASDGGTYDASTRTLTWSLGTLTASGSVSFRTRIDVESISRTAPTVNIAIIDSTETEPDSGQDDVRVVVQPPPAGGNPRPRPRVPDTAMAPPAAENDGYVAVGAATLIASLAWALGGPLAAGRRRELAACHATHDARDK